MICSNTPFGRIRLACPKCRSQLSAPLAWAGKLARCPQCGFASPVPREPASTNDSCQVDLTWRLPCHVGHEHYLATLNAAAAQRSPGDLTRAPTAARSRLDLMSWILLTANLIATTTIIIVIGS